MANGVVVRLKMAAPACVAYASARTNSRKKSWKSKHKAFPAGGPDALKHLLTSMAIGPLQSSSWALGGRWPSPSSFSMQCSPCFWLLECSLQVKVEPIPPFSKRAILLVFVAQSTPRRCKSHVGFSFLGLYGQLSMGLYTTRPKTRKWRHFLKCTF